MKGCGIAIIVVLIVLMILATAALVVFFGFEKDLPSAFVEKIKAELDGMGDATITVDYNFVNNFGDITTTVTRETIKDNTSTLEKGVYERVGKDDTLKLTVKVYDREDALQGTVKFYIEDGKYLFANNNDVHEISEATWKNAISEAFAIGLPLEPKDGDYKIIGGEYIENNLSRITQKGMSITAYAYNGDDEYCLSYNIRSMLMGQYRITYRGKATDPYDKYIVTYTADVDISRFM